MSPIKTVAKLCKYGGMKIIKKDLLNTSSLSGFKATERKEGDPGLRELKSESGLMWIWTREEARRASERVVRKGESHTFLRELGIQAQLPGPSDITD